MEEETDETGGKGEWRRETKETKEAWRLGTGRRGMEEGHKKMEESKNGGMDEGAMEEMSGHILIAVKFILEWLGNSSLTVHWCFNSSETMVPEWLRLTDWIEKSGRMDGEEGVNG